MDYTTTTLVKNAMGTSATADDTLLTRLVTATSRAIDRKLTGAVRSDDYLKAESVSGETGRGIADKDGVIHYWSHKPLITSVSAFAFRYSPLDASIAVNTSYIQIDAEQMLAFAGVARGRPFITVSYAGGLAATQAALPEDVIEAATVLAVRYYKEIKSGLSDSIGVAELGTLIYTKAWPIRVLDLLAPYMRRNPMW